MARQYVAAPDGRWGARALPPTPIPQQTTTEYWRYLGMVQNGQGDIEDMLDRLTVEMGDAAEVLSRRKVTLAAALYLCNVVLLPQALYRLKLSHASSGGCRRRR